MAVLFRVLVVVAILAFGSAARAEPVPYAVDTANSLFTVLTRPAGPAAAFGHPHLIVAQAFEATLEVDRDELSASRFTVVVPVRELAFNPPEALREASPRLRALGVIDRPLTELSPRERQSTREVALSPGQLDAERHPEVKARLLEAGEFRVGDAELPHAALVALTVRGREVTRLMPAEIRLDGERLEVEALGEYRFTEFGIEPFSAAFGLLRNEDRFHLYVKLRAEAAR